MFESPCTVNIYCNSSKTQISLVFKFIDLIKSKQGSHWEDGDEFKPERFLDEEGKVLRDEHLIPFSIGW